MQLGRYQILKQLSTGGIADVLLARATGLEGFARHVVIKRIRGELAAEPRFVNAFLEEARIAASLHHQNIVQVHDIGEQAGTYYFAMEYLHGEDVGKLLQKVRERNEQVPFDLVVAIVTATAAGLHHAHEQRDPAGNPLGLVHRDVTPSNILIGYDGSVKLVDFGMAKAARSTKTASATLTGKASYLAPEQCVGKPVDRRTDVFSLGVVLFELATASRLFKAANDFLTMAAIVEGEVPAPSTFRSSIPPALDAIVLRALARDPDSRFQTVEDLREALERFAQEYQLRTSNKALADYLIALFGQRPEPWQEGDDGVETSAPRQADPTHGKGLVAPPADNGQLIKRIAPRATSPIMLAQAAIEEDADSDEFIDDFQTFVLRKSSEIPVPQRALTPPPRTFGEEDPFFKTIVTPPPKFDKAGDIASATPVRDISDLDTNTPVRDISDLDTNTPVRDIGDIDTQTPLIDAGTPVVPVSEVADLIEASRPQPKFELDDGLHARPEPERETPPRAASELLYVGPPAPPQPRGRVRTFLAHYGRSIALGAGAGFLVVAMATIVFYACSPPRHKQHARSGEVTSPTR